MQVPGVSRSTAARPSLLRQRACRSVRIMTMGSTHHHRAFVVAPSRKLRPSITGYTTRIRSGCRLVRLRIRRPYLRYPESHLASRNAGQRGDARLCSLGSVRSAAFNSITCWRSHLQGVSCAHGSLKKMVFLAQDRRFTSQLPSSAGASCEDHQPWLLGLAWIANKDDTSLLSASQRIARKFKHIHGPVIQALRSSINEDSALRSDLAAKVS